MTRSFPKLYVLLDAAWPASTAPDTLDALAESGAELLQYRDKRATSRQLFETASALSRQPKIVSAAMRLIVNDRPDVALLSGAGGVHLGQQDIGVEEARSIVGPDRWVGVSTHTLDQLAAADRTSADYIAFGPIFVTATKEHPDPLVGLEGLAAARARTHKPLVAIGGITLVRAAEVYAAGADSLAVARDLLDVSGSLPKFSARVRAYLDVAAHANILAGAWHHPATPSERRS